MSIVQNNDSPLLSVENLSVDFSTEAGCVRAVDDVSFQVRPGQTLGIVGESGCGKSVTSLAIMGLLPHPAGRIAAGAVRLRLDGPDSVDLAGLPERRMRRLRGAELSMIFQEPMTALNPVFTVGSQMVDILARHERLSRRQARDRAIEMLARVGIPLPQKRIDEYPHELSGGMRQRVMIAMALSCRPGLLIADEPTTALDVTTQAQVLEQIVELQREMGMAVILITHDLGVIAETCDEALVMYCGRVVEQAPVDALFRAPRHRYTQGLIEAIPRIRRRRLERLPVIPGMVPDLSALPPGCRFSARCGHASDRCRAEQPALESHGASRVACFHPADPT
ncbi:MAG: ABC transporter ATP-binding protein [Wenzhouxiangellaceae bacterium]|nr:ABC transporter ATP-binding protein [Wenzhouxiangellaceae bacterium]